MTRRRFDEPFLRGSRVRRPAGESLTVPRAHPRQTGPAVSSAVDLEKPADDASGATPPRRDVGRALVRGVGQALITLGLVTLLFVVYELWVTDLFAAREQTHLSHEIHQQWADAPTVAPAPATPFTPAPIDV